METKRSRKHRAERLTSLSGKDFFGRGKGQIHDGRGIQKSGKNASCNGWAGIHSMKLSLEERNFIEVVSRQGSHDFLKDSGNQVMIIEKTLKALSLHPEFSDTSKWNEDTQLHQVLEWIMEEASRICKDMDWTIDEEEKFQVHLPLYDIDSFWHLIPLKFLPEIEKTNKKLHEMLIVMVSLFSKNICVSLWDDEDMDYALESIKEDIESNDDNNEEYYTQMRELVKEYETTGCEYLFRIKNNKKNLNWLKKELASFKPRNIDERRLYRWLKRGFKLLNSNFSIMDFIHNPYKCQAYDHYPLLPDRYFTFTWGLNDRVVEFALHSMDINYQDYGVEPFYQKHFIRRRRDWDFTKIKTPVWPKLLSEFFQEGYYIAESLL